MLLSVFALISGQNRRKIKLYKTSLKMEMFLSRRAFNVTMCGGQFVCSKESGEEFLG